MLDRRKGHQDAVVSPQVPTRRPGGHAVLDHEPYRQINHAVGVLTAGWRQLRQGRREVRMTWRTIMLCIRDDALTRTPQGESPHVRQRPLALRVPIGLGTTTRTRLARGGATGRDDLWRWHVCHRGHPFGGIGSIRTRTAQGFALRDHLLEPALYDTCPSGAIPKPGKDAIVSSFHTFFSVSLWTGSTTLNRAVTRR